MDEFDDYDFEPIEDEESPIVVDIDIKDIKEKLAAFDQQKESTEPLQDSYETMEEEFVGSSFVLEETCIILPETEEILEVDLPHNIEIKEPTFFNLPNETYDPEFAPRNQPIEAAFLSSIELDDADVEEEISPIDLDDEVLVEDAMFQEVSTPIQEKASFTYQPAEVEVETNTLLSEDEPLVYETIPSKPILTSVQTQSSKDRKEAQDPLDFTIPLDDNPYFGSRKMNFKWKPVILSILTVAFVLCLFVSVFVLIKAFK